MLVEGLKGAADKDNNHQITLNELKDYLQREVPRIVRKEFKVQQIPEMYLKDMDGDLPIFVY